MTPPPSPLDTATPTPPSPRAPAQAAKPAQAGLFLALFTAIWTAACVGMNITFLSGSAKQIEAESFPTVPGRVTASSVDKQSNGEGGYTYGAQLRYSYTIAGVDYSSDRRRHNDFKTSGGTRAREAVARYPAGAAVTVHYDPANPAEAVLETGVDGLDLFALMFVTPFNVVTIGLVWMWLGSLHRRITGFDAPPHARVSRPAAALVYAAASSFGLVFLVAFGTGLNPTLETMQIAWVCVAAATLFGFAKAPADPVGSFDASSLAGAS